MNAFLEELQFAAEKEVERWTGSRCACSYRNSVNAVLEEYARKLLKLIEEEK